MVNNEVALPSPDTAASTSLVSETDMISVLRNSLYPGASDGSIRLVLAWCKAQNKDPLKRPVHIVPMWVKTGEKDPKGYDKHAMRDIIMPGIGDYRTDAARTGQYAGISEARWGEDKTEELGDVRVTYPEWCEMSVYRIVAGQRCEFSSGRIYWKETYVTKNKDTSAPNAMWGKRIRGQLEKCAEAMALRRAFPEVGGNPTAEEMAGRSLDEDVVEKQVIEPPRAIADKVVEKADDSPPQALVEKDAEIVGERAPRKTNGEMASTGAIKMIQAKALAVGVDNQELFLAHGLKSLDDIRADQVRGILKWLET